MTFAITFKATDGLWREATDATYETYKDADAALTAAENLTEEEASRSVNLLALLAADGSVRRMWIQERMPISCNRTNVVSELTRRPPIEQAVDFFRELDPLHGFDHDRLDMTRWGHEGIEAFVQNFAILNDYWSDHDCRDAEQNGRL